MFNIVLYQPEIPPNTGNIIRLCANSGAILQLIYPLGFSLTDKKLRRAGLDYAKIEHICQHHDFTAWQRHPSYSKDRTFAFSTKAKKHYTDNRFLLGDSLLFGPETRGLPDSILTSFSEQNCLRLPMVNTSRSMNLSNVVAIVLYEALRQNHFPSLS